MDHFFYVAESQFDQEDAVNNRIINNIKAITDKSDFIVTIIGYGDEKEIVKEGITIKNVKKGNGAIQKLFYFLFRGLFVSRLLRKERIKPAAVIYYGVSARFFFPLMRYARRGKIKIICDMVEWYNLSHLPLGKFGPLALDANFGIKFFIPRCDGLIAISSYLQNYFVSKNMKVIRVPVLIDSRRIINKSNKISAFDEEYLNLIYAGFPGKKDLVLNIVDAVEKLSRKGAKIRFHLIGPSKTGLEKQFSRHFSDAIICHGKLKQSSVTNYLQQADFSVLLRPRERYAEAGFPTKFVESLNAGLPVIANITSDLSYYLKDGYNGFIVDDSSVDSLVNVLKKVINSDKEEFELMRKNALLTSRQNFDYRLFTGDFTTFFKQIIRD